MVRTAKDFRRFRTDRMLALAKLDERYPRRRAVMLRERREIQPDDDYQIER